MRRTVGLLVLAATAISGPCLAKGKTSLPIKVPGFVQANNGLGAVAALRGGDFVTRVIMHFAGLDPPLEWVPPPKTAEVIPAWMDEPVVMPASLTAIGVPACGKSDLGQLVAHLQEEATPAAAQPLPQGLIHVDAPAAPSVPPGGAGLDGRAIYGHPSDGCLMISAQLR
jgi:hypothetical protein